MSELFWVVFPIVFAVVSTIAAWTIAVIQRRYQLRLCENWVELATVACAIGWLVMMVASWYQMAALIN